MHNNPPYISVIIPAYNESGRIENTLVETTTFLRNYSWELIVVDDGSRDDTSAVVTSCIENIPDARLISYLPNAGKGRAVKTGILDSSGEYVLFMDADNSTRITEIESAWPLMDEGGCHIAIGSRGLHRSDTRVHQPVYRKIGSWTFKWFHRLTIGLGFIAYTQCGFKLFRGDVARWLFTQMRIDGFMFDIESLYLAQKLGLTIKEFPVIWMNDPDSRLRLFYDTFRMFKHLASIRMRPVRPLRAKMPEL